MPACQAASRRKAILEEELVKQYREIVDGVTIGPEVVADIKTGLKVSAVEAARCGRLKEPGQGSRRDADPEKRL